MRVRLNTKPPLEPLKAWFPVSDNSTLVSVKKSICDALPGLNSSSTIKLELDGFELLDSSVAQDVLREGDIIDVCLLGAFLYNTDIT
jgi:hypothetical protein